MMSKQQIITKVKHRTAMKEIHLKKIYENLVSEKRVSAGAMRSALFEQYSEKMIQKAQNLMTEYGAEKSNVDFKRNVKGKLCVFDGITWGAFNCLPDGTKI